MSAIFSQISPGDVIAFSGNGIDAKIIRWFTMSPYSHVAIVLDTEYPNQQCDDILIAESTIYTNIPDFQAQKCFKGVQVHWLSNWLAAYQACGRAWWFPLQQKPSYDRMAQMQSWLWHLHSSHTPFACRKSVGAWLAQNKYFKTETKKQSPKTTTALFCAELVTEALQVAGIIDAKLNPATQTPKDLMNLACFEKPTLIL